MANKKVFVIDLANCNGCHAYQIACKDEHVGNDWSPVAKPQPDSGQFWLELIERVRSSVPKVKLEIKSGGKIKHFSDLNIAESDINLGDIPFN